MLVLVLSKNALGYIANHSSTYFSDLLKKEYF